MARELIRTKTQGQLKAKAENSPLHLVVEERREQQTKMIEMLKILDEKGDKA